MVDELLYLLAQTQTRTRRHALTCQRCWKTHNLVENVVAGPRWAKYYIGPLQFIICFGTVIGGPLVGGKSLKVVT